MALVTSPNTLISRLALAAVSVGLMLGGPMACNMAPEGSVQEGVGYDSSKVGEYDAPPPEIAMSPNKPSLGIPPFQSSDYFEDKRMNAVVADQLYTLMFKTKRFKLKERAYVDKLMQERGLSRSGEVTEGDVIQLGQMSGIDYMVVGKITNFAVKSSKQENNAAVRLLGKYLTGYDYKNTKSYITVEVGIDLRIIDTKTGDVFAADFYEFEKTDRIESFGVQVLGYHENSTASLRVDSKNQGKIVRYALDELLKKMLPDIDEAMLAKNFKSTGTSATKAKDGFDDF